MACSNNEETVGNCTTKSDGNVNQLDAGCITGTEIEHVRLEGVTISSGASIVVWVRSNATQTSGVKLTLSGDGTITYENLDGGKTVSKNGFTMTGSKVFCSDMHFDEDPDHVIVWENASCNTTYDGNTGTNLIDDNTNAGNVTTEGNVYYQVNGAATSTNITAKGPIAENIWERGLFSFS